jgi:hypothetical protein
MQANSKLATSIQVDWRVLFMRVQARSSAKERAEIRHSGLAPESRPIRRGFLLRA